ncbi:helix-turn-helix transcriptional regulator [Rhodoblastus sp.]|uniref:helix-turn-helix transcriptional regulator n=1 Tax=Rhodoblastus sp. TaxID=1962975 RepID=UPI003F980C5C
MRLEKSVAVLKLARALAINREGLTLDEMADFLGVGRRTAERMRDAVEQAFGLLDHEDDGRKKRFRLAISGLDRFTAIPTVDEMTELENAARKLEAAHDTDRAEKLRTLRDKIETSLRDNDRRKLGVDVEAAVRAETFACQVGPRPMSDPTILSALREALLAGKVVRFDYGGHEETPPRWRKVVPYGLLFGPRYYLVAGMKSRRGAVLYRLDAIHNLVVTDEPGAPPSDFDLKGYAARSFGVFQEEPEDVILRFAPSAAHDAKAYLFHPTQTLTDEADGSLTVRFHAGGLLQIAHHLMTWREAVTIVAPKALQDVMREQVAALCRHYVEPQSSKGSKRRPSTRNSSRSSS